jgi:hypothetical protein
VASSRGADGNPGLSAVRSSFFSPFSGADSGRGCRSACGLPPCPGANIPPSKAAKHSPMIRAVLSPRRLAPSVFDSRCDSNPSEGCRLKATVVLESSRICQ